MILCDFFALKSFHESCTCCCITIKYSSLFVRALTVSGNATFNMCIREQQEQSCSSRVDSRIWAGSGWECPQQWDEVSEGPSPAGRGGCWPWDPPGDTDKWVSLWVIPQKSRKSRWGQTQSWIQSCRMRPKSIQETGMNTAHLQGVQEKTHRAWIYAWCRARGSGQNKTQAVTRIAPPCTLKVFYLADRQSHSNLSFMKILLQIFLIF